MKQVTLNGMRMDSIEASHSYMVRKLHLPDYYGRNLDALWDILSTTSEHLHITLVNHEQLLTSLGDYGARIVDVFEEAAQTNDSIRFELKD